MQQTNKTAAAAPRTAPERYPADNRRRVGRKEQMLFIMRNFDRLQQDNADLRRRLRAATLADVRAAELEADLAKARHEADALRIDKANRAAELADLRAELAALREETVRGRRIMEAANALLLALSDAPITDDTPHPVAALIASLRLALKPND